MSDGPIMKFRVSAVPPTPGHSAPFVPFFFAERTLTDAKKKASELAKRGYSDVEVQVWSKPAQMFLPVPDQAFYAKKAALVDEKALVALAQLRETVERVYTLTSAGKETEKDQHTLISDALHLFGTVWGIDLHEYLP